MPRADAGSSMCPRCNRFVIVDEFCHSLGFSAGAISRASSADPERDQPRPRQRDLYSRRRSRSFRARLCRLLRRSAMRSASRSGTDALILALKALGIGPGDEVITVSHTAVATVAAILATGATPVLVDVDAGLPDARSGAHLRRRVDAAHARPIIAVHLYGQAADLDAIMSDSRSGTRSAPSSRTARRPAAAAIAAGGSAASAISAASASIRPKISARSATAAWCLTREPKIAERVRRLRQYGWDEAAQTHEARAEFAARSAAGGDPARQAAASRRRQCAARGDRAALRARPSRLAAHDAEGARGRQHVYHLYVVACAQRDALMAHLADARSAAPFIIRCRCIASAATPSASSLPAAACR